MKIILPTHLDQWKEGVVLLVDKPLNWTSFDVVNKLRYTISRKVGKLKVGHAGTLDPLATGLLVICTGKKTKEIDLLQATEKEYIGTLKLGYTTASYDSEQPEQNELPFAHISESVVKDAMKTFEGNILQAPPIFSAIKVDGKKAYNIARKEKTIDLPLRPVTILDYSLTDFDLPFVKFHVGCSKGTYIRSLVHDLGQQLGTGAYMTALVRTRSGEHSLSQAHSLSELVSYIENMPTDC